MLEEALRLHGFRCAFGWIKMAAGQVKTRFRGVEWVELAFTFVAAVANLVRLPKLLADTK